MEIHPSLRGSSPEPVEEHGYIDIGGRQVSVHRGRSAGDAVFEAPVLVFLHEALGCHAMWKAFPKQLSAATGLPYLSYDRLGHGRSGPLPGPRDKAYLDREAFETLPAVLEACGVADPIMVGHSDGGTIALTHASRHPVRAVVTEAAHVFVEDVTIAGIRDAVESWRTTDLRDRLARHHGAGTGALFRAWADTWLSPEFRSWTIEHHLPDITAPCLVIQGIDDEYGTVRQVEAIADGVSGPARSMLVPDCRHVPHLQAADHILPTIVAFLDEYCR